MFDLVEIGLQCIVLRYWIICTVSGSTDWDDDEEEVAEAEAAGIEAVLVPVEGDVTHRLRDKWLDHMAKSEEETN